MALTGFSHWTDGNKVSELDIAEVKLGVTVLANNAQIVALTTAITANTTTTTAIAGSLGLTTHATGVGKLFVSDGSKWQFVAVA